MKKLIYVFAAGISLVACSSSDSELTSTSILSSSSTSSVTDTTDVTSPTSKVTTILKSALPKLVKCPLNEISSDTTEIFKDIIRCADKWAVGIPQRYVEKFNGDTDVEAEWVLTNKKGKWTVVGVCHIYYPLFPNGPICNNPYNDNPIDLDLIPPMPVQCVLWDGASLSGNIAETGCPKDSWTQ